jgi:nicotinate-nucleotide pyrophosphorylase (carboxylating)
MTLIESLIDLALEEDIGPGDITTDNLVDDKALGVGTVLAKEPLILAGIDLADRVFKHLDPETTVSSDFQDGQKVPKGETVFTVKGKLQTILKGERTALNFLQRLSGVATMTRAYVNALGTSKARLVDTRKTNPGLRVLEKYAVRVGGAANHRMGLYDGVLIKDNHIAACGGISRAVQLARQRIHHLVKIEVETTTMIEVDEALEAKADVIMLDNMSVEQIKQAVIRIDGKAIVEVSGGVTIDNLKALANCGVDLISVGALTHSCKSVDMSMIIDTLSE